MEYSALLPIVRTLGAGRGKGTKTTTCGCSPISLLYYRFLLFSFFNNFLLVTSANKHSLHSVGQRLQNGAKAVVLRFAVGGATVGSIIRFDIELEEVLLRGSAEC